MNNMLYNIISKVLGIPISEINDQSSPETLRTWDSFNSLLLLHEIEKEFSISIDFEDFSSVKSVNDIKILLKNHGVVI